MSSEECPIAAKIWTISFLKMFCYNNMPLNPRYLASHPAHPTMPDIDLNHNVPIQTYGGQTTVWIATIYTSIEIVEKGRFI